MTTDLFGCLAAEMFTLGARFMMLTWTSELVSVVDLGFRERTGHVCVERLLRAETIMCHSPTILKLNEWHHQVDLLIVRVGVLLMRVRPC